MEAKKTFEKKVMTDEDKKRFARYYSKRAKVVKASSISHAKGKVVKSKGSKEENWRMR